MCSREIQSISRQESKRRHRKHFTPCEQTPAPIISPGGPIESDGRRQGNERGRLGFRIDQDWSPGCEIVVTLVGQSNRLRSHLKANQLGSRMNTVTGTIRITKRTMPRKISAAVSIPSPKAVLSS